MTNYNKSFKKQTNAVKPVEKVETEEVIRKPINAQPVEETNEPVEGIVTNCDQLYVRSEPSVDAEPLGVIKKDTSVRIYEDESTSDFFSVCTESGLEGFCMKKFISVL